MKRAISASVVDQAVLSAQSLLVGLFLIRFGGSDSVGRFALSMALYFAFLAAQDSLFGSILANRVYGRTSEEQTRVVGLISSIAASYFLFAAVLVAVGVCLWFDFDPIMVSATAAMMIAGLLRELARAVAISFDVMGRCLSMDSLAALLTLAVLLPLTDLVVPEAACLFAIAIGHGTAFLLLKPNLHFSLSDPRSLLHRYAPLFRLTRWSFVGSISDEAKSRTFLFLVETLRGLQATATLHVGRLIISPVMLIVLAVGRVVLPRMANHFHENRTEQAYDMFRRMSVFLVLMTALYGLLVYASWPLLDRYLFRDNYPEIAETMAVWCVYAIASSPLTCLYWLFRAQERFRELALVKLANASGVLLAMSCLMFDVPLYTAILILIAGNICAGCALLSLVIFRSPAANELP